MDETGEMRDMTGRYTLGQPIGEVTIDLSPEALEKIEIPEDWKNVNQTIELDSPPGAARPWDLLPGVIEGTGLPLRDSGAFFGHAEFGYSDVDTKVWLAIRPTLEKRVKALYDSGRIRYGSW